MSTFGDFAILRRLHRKGNRIDQTPGDVSPSPLSKERIPRNDISCVEPANLRTAAGRGVLTAPRARLHAFRGRLNSFRPKAAFFAQIFRRCSRLMRVAQTSKSAVSQVFNLQG